MKLVKLHLGLARFIRKEITKQNTPQKLIKFCKEICKAYLKQLIGLYKELFLIFDKNYREQKKKYEKYNQIKKDLNNALRLLKFIDTKLAKMGKGRTERRRFWREFFKDAEIRTEIFDQLDKEIGGQ